jgi:prolyl-tRNA synthetase
MMDLYSFDTDEEASAESYQKMLQAYKNIYERCGLPTIVVEADSGAIGGKESHEFTLLTDSGEDEIIYCSSCDYAANVERAESIKPRLLEEKSLPIEEVATPGKKTIEEVAEFLKVPKERTLKAVFYSADGELVFVVIRGDMDVNEVKLKNALGCYELRLASDEEVQGAGLVAGSASPLGLSGVRVVADDSITMGSNFIAGANKPNHHLRNVNYPRDFEVDMLLDIAKARAEQRCPRCGSKLLSRRGIEVGHTFKLGTTFSEKLGAYYLGRDGERKPIFMGCYGIGTGRLVAAAIEQNHDEKGIIWLHSIAPYQVHLCALSMNDPQVLPAVEELYSQLEAEGLEVLYDDRRESAGVKFNDADLLGIPIRLVISSRSLRSQSVELKWRTERKSQSLPLDGIVSKLKELLTPNSL